MPLSRTDFDGDRDLPPIKVSVKPGLAQGWAETYTAIADEEGFPVDDVEDAASQVRAFIEEIDAAGGR